MEKDTVTIELDVSKILDEAQRIEAEFMRLALNRPFWNEWGKPNKDLTRAGRKIKSVVGNFEVFVRAQKVKKVISVVLANESVLSWKGERLHYEDASGTIPAVGVSRDDTVWVARGLPILWAKICGREGFKPLPEKAFEVSVSVGATLRLSLEVGESREDILRIVRESLSEMMGDSFGEQLLDLTVSVPA